MDTYLTGNPSITFLNRESIIQYVNLTDEISIDENREVVENREVYENRKITNDDDCPVNLEKIEKNEEYILCSTCNKNFKINMYDYILKNKKCPHCRCTITNIKKYINI